MHQVESLLVRTPQDISKAYPPTLTAALRVDGHGWWRGGVHILLRAHHLSVRRVPTLPILVRLHARLFLELNLRAHGLCRSVRYCVAWRSVQFLVPLFHVPLMLLPFVSLLVCICHFMVLGLLLVGQHPQRRPSSFTISPLCPIPKFGFWLITF